MEEFDPEVDIRTPIVQEPHSSHHMRRFSDIPWGCWVCGACSCHHAGILREPCRPDARKKKP